MYYQIWCNGAAWSGAYTLRNALRQIADLAHRTDLDEDRQEWVIRLVKIKAER
jgi:hypothetical protein